MSVKNVMVCGRHRGPPPPLCWHTADKKREKMTLRLHTARSLFKMHPKRGGNDFGARGCAPPQTFNDSFEFLAVRPCVGARQTEDAPSTISVGVCERGSMEGGELLCGSKVQNVQWKYQNAAGCSGAQHSVWNINSCCLWITDLNYKPQTTDNRTTLLYFSEWWAEPNLNQRRWGIRGFNPSIIHLTHCIMYTDIWQAWV